MPRDYLLRLMRDESLPRETRMQAASMVARYCHPTFTAVRIMKSMWDLSPNEWQMLLTELRQGPPSEQMRWAPRLIDGAKE